MQLQDMLIHCCSFALPSAISRTQTSRKENSLLHLFHKPEAKCVSALRELLSKVSSHSQALFASSWLDGFLDFEMPFPKSSRRKTKFIILFWNGMWLYGWNQGKRMEQFEHDNIVRQTQAINCRRSTLLGIDLDASTSISLVDRRWDLSSATSTSNADLVVSRSSRPRPQTAHSTSRVKAQWRESRV